jgi:hypothetical protein
MIIWNISGIAAEHNKVKVKRQKVKGRRKPHLIKQWFCGLTFSFLLLPFALLCSAARKVSPRLVSDRFTIF